MGIGQIKRALLLTLGSLALLGSVAVANAQGMSYCRADVARLCPGVPPGGGKIIACLKAHKMEVSIGCGKAIKKMKSQM